LDESLRPNLAILAGAGAGIVLLSVITLPWQAAVASAVLGSLMIAGADVDARTCLLPDIVTWGAVGCGVVAAAALNPYDAWHAGLAAIMRVAGTAIAVASLRWCHARLRTREGLGFGDVKLAAAVGAWLPLQAIPLCFGLAASAALVAVMFARLRGEAISGKTKIPFGAFLCPSLWLIFYVSVLPG
jgi:leader peptidase (prepilin peptidase) / N-methyltransferase